ncbi:hypothetical protein EIP91_012113 [Steccherinum ochraceum]|uniref:Uncharacterized protein n=1 Tax=Steccherinum ochraceum TaxID=92696 RepID=A0A4R0RWE2_9APHY|nr:hypothetical protein EIP91_012113 [Steccherinum ochraceum]
MTASAASTWQPKDGGFDVPVVAINGITGGEALANGEDSSASWPPREARRRVGDDATPPHAPTGHVSGSRETPGHDRSGAEEVDSSSHFCPSRSIGQSAKESTHSPSTLEITVPTLRTRHEHWQKVLSILFQDYWNTSVRTTSLLFTPKTLLTLAQRVRHAMGRAAKGFLEPLGRPTCSKTLGTGQRLSRQTIGKRLLEHLHARQTSAFVKGLSTCCVFQDSWNSYYRRHVPPTDVFQESWNTPAWPQKPPPLLDGQERAGGS